MTDALVLKTTPYSETTLIVTFLTREMGVVRALAKGARRIKQNSGAAFDMLAHVSVSLSSPGGDSADRLGIVRSIELKDAWHYLRSDLKRFALACVAMEVLGAVAGSSPEEPFFFEEAMRYLVGLESTAAPGSLTGAVLLRLLHQAGYPPQVSPSLKGRPLPARVGFDFHEGALAETSALNRQSPGAGPSRWFPIHRDLAEKLIPWFDQPPPLTDAFTIPTSQGPELLRLLIALWEDHLGHPVRAAKFLEQTVLNA